MLLRRLALIGISLAAGYIITVAVLYAPFIADTTLEEYGSTYTFFTVFTLACAVGIWLDKFMGTEILPK